MGTPHCRSPLYIHHSGAKCLQTGNDLFHFLVCAVWASCWCLPRCMLSIRYLAAEAAHTLLVKLCWCIVLAYGLWTWPAGPVGGLVIWMIAPFRTAVRLKCCWPNFIRPDQRNRLETHGFYSRARTMIASSSLLRFGSHYQLQPHLCGMW